MSGFSWDLRIARASELAKTHSAVAELLGFYQGLVRWQKSVYQFVASSSDHDVSRLAQHFPALIALVKATGSPALKETAAQLEQATPEERLDLLQAVWQRQIEVREIPAEFVFFANALLQPFAEYLAERTNSATESSPPLCPFCASKPQVAVLRPEGDGAKRFLLCSLCGTEWFFRRILCPNCAEENKDKLPVFQAQEFDYVRVDACDTCHTYIKSIDLSKNGNAVPVVDELATVSLNLWAQENNYQKLQPNLFGV
ncbi:MAG TPA: formate dehydrogenase accessory protein FdhE [Candidatus Angelobacter sp.]|nr:formate dehydrogenase accessory protein FdhE [Candidatus Angelobacter sp.]